MGKELDKEINNTAYIEKGVGVIAYCSNCHTQLFKGEGKTQLEQRVLRRRVFDHSQHFRGRHDISIVYPHRKENSTIDSEVFLFSTVDTAIAEGIRSIAN